MEGCVGRRENHASEGIVMLLHSLAIWTQPVMSGESLGMLKRPTNPTCVKWSKSCHQTQSCSDPSKVGLFSSHSRGWMLDSRMVMV